MLAETLHGSLISRATSSVWNFSGPISRRSLAAGEELNARREPVFTQAVNVCGLTQDSVDSCDSQDTRGRDVNIPANSFIQKHTAGVDIDLLDRDKQNDSFGAM